MRHGWWLSKKLCYFRWMLTVVVVFGLFWSKIPYHLHLKCSGSVRITVLDFKSLLAEAKLENPLQVLMNTCHSLTLRLEFKTIWPWRALSSNRWRLSISETNSASKQIPSTASDKDVGTTASSLLIYWSSPVMPNSLLMRQVHCINSELRYWLAINLHFKYNLRSLSTNWIKSFDQRQMSLLLFKSLTEFQKK